MIGGCCNCFKAARVNLRKNVQVLRSAAASTSAIQGIQPVKSRPVRSKRVAGLLPAIKANGRITAFSTAEEYSTDGLQKTLAGLSLIGSGKSTDAINLLGEAVLLPAGWSGSSGSGEVFIFENGSFVTWNAQQDEVDTLLNTVIKSPGVEVNPLTSGIEEESMEYRFNTNSPTNDSSSPPQPHVNGNTIILPSTPSPIQSETEDRLIEEDRPPVRFSPLPLPGKLASLDPAILPQTKKNGLPNTENDILLRLAVSAALVRSTKLAVYEKSLDEFLETGSSVPSSLVKGAKIPSKKAIISGFGYLLNMRQQLNLSESNLLDNPDFMWDASTAQERLYHAVCKALEANTRLEVMNKKLDYAENVQKLVLDLADSGTSHRLEWIIIILIAIEIGLAILREGMPHFAAPGEKKEKLEAHIA